MISRHSIFFKIFIGLWITTMLFALTPLLFIFAGDEHTKDFMYEHYKKELDKKNSYQIYDAILNQDLAQMKRQLIKAEKRLNTNGYIFDEYQNEIFGSEYPPKVMQIVMEMQGSDVAIIKKMSNDPDDQRVIRAKKMGRYTLIDYPGDKQPPSYFSIISRQYIHIFVYIMFLSLITSFLVVRYITKPLTSLSKATRNIADGNFSVRVSENIKRKDEIGLLAEDFDLMAKKLLINQQNQESTIRNISHELRSPLTRLRLSLELARVKAGENAASALDRIEKESEQLNDMIGCLLDLSRMKGSHSISTEIINISDTLESVLTDAAFEADGSDKKVYWDIEYDCSIRGNESLLRIGIENIVRNAIKYAAEEVNVFIKKKSEFISINICDDGQGVDDHLLNDIFTPFYRVHDDRDRKTGGTGLGLAIAKTTVEAHGGTIRAYNSDDGFCIEILLQAAV